PEDDDEDVDMIPLIDVSLVLLIFFMMTTTATLLAAFPVNTPPANFAVLGNTPDLVWIGLDFKRDNGKEDRQHLVFAVGDGNEVEWTSSQEPRWATGVPAADADTQAAIEMVVGRVAAKQRIMEVNIRADLDLPEGYVRDLLKALERRDIRAKVK